MLKLIKLNYVVRKLLNALFLVLLVSFVFPVLCVAMVEGQPPREHDVDFHVGLQFEGLRGFWDSGLKGIVFRSNKRETAGVVEVVEPRFMSRKFGQDNASGDNTVDLQEDEFTKWNNLRLPSFELVKSITTIRSIDDAKQVLLPKGINRKEGRGKKKDDTGKWNEKTLLARDHQFPVFEIIRRPIIL
jgi:hypothetical protein